MLTNSEFYVKFASYLSTAKNKEEKMVTVSDMQLAFDRNIGHTGGLFFLRPDEEEGCIHGHNEDGDFYLLPANNDWNKYPKLIIAKLEPDLINICSEIFQSKPTIIYQDSFFGLNILVWMPDGFTTSKEAVKKMADLKKGV